MDPQHGVQRIGRPDTFIANFGVVRLNLLDQRLAGHQRLHLGQEFLALGAFLGRGQRIVPTSRAACKPSPQSWPAITTMIAPWMKRLSQSFHGLLTTSDNAVPLRGGLPRENDAIDLILSGRGSPLSMDSATVLNLYVKHLERLLELLFVILVCVLNLLPAHRQPYYCYVAVLSDQPPTA